MAKCDNDTCKYIAQSHNDLRPYKIDWTVPTEYIPGHSVGDYNMVCSECWNRRLYGPEGKEYIGDSYLYKAGGINIPAISWDDPLGKNSNQTVQITNNYITNNIKNETIYDNKNISYNTSNYNIHTTKFDISSVIDELTKPKKSADEKVKSDIAKSEEKDIKYHERLEKQQQEYENKIRLDVAQKKRERAQRMQEEEEQIAEFKKLYPNAKPLKCEKCNFIKAYPEQYINGRGKTNFKNVCNDCLNNKRDNEALYRKEHTTVCECGLVYFKTSDAAQYKHEQTETHKINMKSRLCGQKYNVQQLRQICVANQVLNASRMSKVDIVEALNKLPSVIIPVFKA